MSAGPGIRFDDRVIVVGDTGSGKSELLGFLHRQVRCQRFILDTKPEFSVPDVEPTTSPDRIDWRAPIIHYVDHAGELEEYDEVFRRILERRKPLSVCVHELGDLCADQPGATPRWVSATWRKGRAFGIGILGGTQRPVGMPKVARTQAQHVIAFATPELDVIDRKLVGQMMGLHQLPEFDAQLAKARELAPPDGAYSYLWFDQRARRLRYGPPLPDRQRRLIDVRRTTV